MLPNLIRRSTKVIEMAIIEEMAEKARLANNKAKLADGELSEIHEDAKC